jgi:hypothetical protein
MAAYTIKPCSEGKWYDALMFDNNADNKKSIQTRSSFLLNDRYNDFRDVHTFTAITASADMINKISRGIKYQDNSPVGPSTGISIKRKNIQIVRSRFLFIDCF